MATYDFICKDCNHSFTVSVPISEKDKVTCPACVNKSLRQDYSGHILVKAGAKSGSGSSASADAGSSCGSSGFG
ncbi:MAG TPA: zinc ribbon domain-containing protein [Bacillota bacterium]